MPRAIHLISTPRDGDRHTDFFRFPVLYWDDPLHQPTGFLLGAFTVFDDGNTGEEEGWLCVHRTDLVQIFSRIRKFKATIAFAGTVDRGEGPETYSFFYQELTDLLLPGKTVDERFTGHGRCKYLRVIGFDGDNCNGTASIFLDYYAQPVFQPGNANTPFLLFDTDPIVDEPPQVCPRIAFSPLQNSGVGAWYIRIGNAIGSPGLSVRAGLAFAVESPPPAPFGLSIGWQPSWQPLGDSIGMGPANLQIGPISVPGVLSKSADFGGVTYDVTIDDDGFSFTVLADTNGNFEFRKLTGFDPVWGISTGALLIDPVPKVQD